MVELLKKLIAEQMSVYRRTNVVKSEQFSEIMKRTLNAYLNGMLTNEELIAITKELANTLRKNRTIDWQKKESARAKMRMLIKKLLRKHKYPPEGMEDAVQTVMTQCELWTDNSDMVCNSVNYMYDRDSANDYMMVAEDSTYGN